MIYMLLSVTWRLSVQVGDLVTIRPVVARPELYGVGLIVKIKSRRCFVQWSNEPDRQPRSCEMAFLELVNESR